MADAQIRAEARYPGRVLTDHPKWIKTFGDPFRPLEPECNVVQFTEKLTHAQLEKAAAIMRGRPDVLLYVWGSANKNLDFLQYFPELRRLKLDLYKLEDIAGFAHHDGGLEELTFTGTRKTFSLRFLARFPELRKLFLQQHRKDLAVIQELRHLTKLGLSGITFPDLSVLLPLAQLRHLSIFFGGTTNLEMLRQLPALESLFLMRITKLSDLGVLADVKGLRTLRLDWMRNVTSLRDCRRSTT